MSKAAHVVLSPHANRRGLVAAAVCSSPSPEEDYMPKSKTKLEAKKLGRVLPLKKR